MVILQILLLINNYNIKKAIFDTVFFLNINLKFESHESKVNTISFSYCHFFCS